jgi:intein/homing endonuclease
LTFNTTEKKYYWIKPFAVLPTPTEDKEKYELEFDDGTVIKTTYDHKFFTTNRGWVEAQELSEEDNIEHYVSQDIGVMDVTEEELRTEYPQFF